MLTSVDLKNYFAEHGHHNKGILAPQFFGKKNSNEK